MVKRKSMHEIFEKMLSAIPQRGSPQPLSVIAEKAGISYETAERYLDIILLLQDSEKIDISMIGEQKGYSQRETRKKRP